MQIMHTIMQDQKPLPLQLEPVLPWVHNTPGIFARLPAPQHSTGLAQIISQNKKKLI